MKPLVATVAVLVALATGAPVQAQTPELRALAEQGDAGVQFLLGLMYDNGQGVVLRDTPAERASDPATIRRHAAEDLGATGAGRLTLGLSATKSAWRRKSIGAEQCLRNALKAGARVGSTSSAASAGSGTTCDEEIWRTQRSVGVQRP